MGETWLRARLEGDFVGRRRVVSEIAGAQTRRVFEILLVRARLTEVQRVGAPPPVAEAPEVTPNDGDPESAREAWERWEKTPFRQRRLEEAFIDTGRRDPNGIIWLHCAIENLEVRAWTLMESAEDGEHSRGTLRGDAYACIVDPPEVIPAPQSPAAPFTSPTSAAVATPMVTPSVPDAPVSAPPLVSGRPLEPLPAMALSGSMESRMGCAPWLIGLASIFAFVCILPSVAGLVRMQPWWWLIAATCGLGALLFHSTGSWRNVGLGMACAMFAGVVLLLILGHLGFTLAAVVSAVLFGGLGTLPWGFVLAIVGLLAAAGLGLTAGRAWGGRLAEVGGLGLLLLAAGLFLLRVPSFRGPSLGRLAEASTVVRGPDGGTAANAGRPTAEAPSSPSSGASLCTVGRTERIGSAPSLDRIAAWSEDDRTFVVSLDSDTEALRTGVHLGTRIQWVRTPSERGPAHPRCYPDACDLARSGHSCTACDSNAGTTVDLAVARDGDGHAEVVGLGAPTFLVARSEAVAPSEDQMDLFMLAPSLVALSRHRSVIATLVDGVPQFAWNDDGEWTHEAAPVAGTPRYSTWSIAAGRAPGSLLYAALAPVPGTSWAALWVGRRRLASIDGATSFTLGRLAPELGHAPRVTTTRTGGLVALVVSAPADGISRRRGARIAVVEFDPDFRLLGHVRQIDGTEGAVPIRWLETGHGAVLLSATAGDGAREVFATPMHCTRRHRP